MRKLLLSVLLCSALVMGLLPAAAFATELGNTPESVEEAPTPVLEEPNRQRGAVVRIWRTEKCAGGSGSGSTE